MKIKGELKINRQRETIKRKLSKVTGADNQDGMMAPDKAIEKEVATV